MRAMRSSHVGKNQLAADAGHRTRSIYTKSEYQLNILSTQDRDGKGGGISNTPHPDNNRTTLYQTPRLENHHDHIPSQDPKLTSSV